MSAPATIKFVQGVNTPPAGRALDGVIGTAVTGSNNNDTDIVSWSWVLEDVPAGSAVAVGSLGTAAAMNPFTPDVTGTYLVKLTTVDNVGLQTVDYRAVMVKQTATYANRYLPGSFARALVEQSHNIGGQERGYAPFLESYLKVIDRLGDVGGAAPANGDFLVWVAANNRWEAQALAAGAPGGATNSVQYNAGGGIFGGATNVLAGTNYISVGPIPSATGLVRLDQSATVEQILCRNAADSADLVIATYDASDYLWLGVAADATSRRAVQVGIYPLNQVYLGAAGTTTGMFTSDRFVAYGGITALTSGTVAGSGNLRAPNNTRMLAFRDAANTDDLVAVESDASDNLYVGTDSGFARPRPPVLTLGGAQLAVTGPIKGDTNTSSPWGHDGEVTIDMADANYTATAAEYANGVIKNGAATVQTAARTLTMPNATDANSYVKFYKNLNGGGFDLVVTDVAAGNTVAIADGFGAWVGIDAQGAYRMSADVVTT